ncbi:MAG: prepilin-type N-terminal cleavage/methylation domain-containing protein [Rickettsiales bacterium]|nr:prepilin-type N-terminal cleavage/methylation domain-containing protein [Pseudomonadota bacterium]MDA0966165.1 prepilin-type N-terminal cleavage/methylation domain-containing protein [Pseudomonadota bacterium]MDG4543170.1 prepilin-type N-terminal cleavage/methylation domain-containing protein [Rickettsiales bacterium]MDG4545368.1 prepilin-type N-terminal cleavage/methylation domain-containing protein [Rickettsiales bacterium]MDG4547817.1 prepilin-type N-terminal cleavage/methylation domain-c
MKFYLLNLKNRKKQKGFSLVELSVVVAIIGVIVAGVIGGQQLYDAAKLRRLSTEIIQYTSAINTFKEEYGYWPGDFPQATSFWTTAGGVTITNGDGDGRVRLISKQNGEDLYAWAHLTGSELIPAQFSGVVADVGNIHFDTGVNIPSSQPYGNISFTFYSVTGSPPSEDQELRYLKHYGTKLRIGIVNDSTGGIWAGTNSLNARQAKSVDDKIDDGDADSGNLITHRIQALGGCATADHLSNVADYDLDSPLDSCIIEWYLDKL